MWCRHLEYHLGERDVCVDAEQVPLTEPSGSSKQLKEEDQSSYCSQQHKQITSVNTSISDDDLIEDFEDDVAW